MYGPYNPPTPHRGNMFRTALSLFSVFMLMVAGCLPEFPKVGTVAGQTDTTPHLNDTTVTDTINHTDTHTTIGTDTVGTDTTTRDDASPNPSLEEFRPCTTDKECINSESEGTYYCSSGGLCVSSQRGCTSDKDCADASVCNGIETCWYGSCYLGPRIICDDGDEWTDEECNPSTGCMPPWHIYECIEDDDCGDPDLRCSNQLGGTCIERDPCITDTDCGDINACTYDMCVVGRCENYTIVCHDGHPDTLDLCDPAMISEPTGCYFPKMCYEDRNCVDDKSTTESFCVEGECVHIKTWTHLSIFSFDYSGAKIDLAFGNVHWIGRLPYQIHFPFQELCSTGLLIDVKDDDDTCLPLDPYSIDVWQELEELGQTIVDDGCGGAVFIDASLFGCTP